MTNNPLYGTLWDSHSYRKAGWNLTERGLEALKGNENNLYGDWAVKVKEINEETVGLVVQLCDRDDHWVLMESSVVTLPLSENIIIATGEPAKVHIERGEQ